MWIDRFFKGFEQITPPDVPNTQHGCVEKVTNSTSAL